MPQGVKEQEKGLGIHQRHRITQQRGACGSQEAYSVRQREFRQKGYFPCRRTGFTKMDNADSELEIRT